MGVSFGAPAKPYLISWHGGAVLKFCKAQPHKIPSSEAAPFSAFSAALLLRAWGRTTRGGRSCVAALKRDPHGPSIR